MTSELIVWHDLDGYSRGVVNGHDRYLIQPVALEGFHGFELLKPTSEGDLQLGYYKRVSTAKQIAEDREAARARRGQQRERDDAEIAQSRFHRRTGAEEAPRRKMEDEYVLQGTYGHGWEDLTAESTRKEIVQRKREYVENEGGNYRIVHRRVPVQGGPAVEEVVSDESRPWPRRGGAREDGGPSGALDWKQHGGDWVAKTFGGASYRLVPEGEDGFHTYYERGGHKEDLGGHPTLGAAMGAARRHRPPMSRAAEEGGAEERVPVVHEDGVEAAVVSVTKSETVTVAAAQEAGGSEDFSTVGHAEQHAYTEGFRFIAKHGKRYHVYKRKPVGKKGYERREMYHRRGKWHISGDRKTVSRLGEGARAIKVSQTAGTLRKEELPPEAPRDEPAAAAGESGETFYIVDTRIGKAIEGPYADVDDADRAMRNYSKRTHQVIAGRYLNDLAFQGDGAKVQRGAGEDAKFERCVRAVKKRGDDVNPYAVCTASVGQGREAGEHVDVAAASEASRKRIRKGDYITWKNAYNQHMVGIAHKRLRSGWELKLPGQRYAGPFADFGDIVKVESPEEYKRRVAGARENARMTLAQAKAELRPLGLVLISHDGEYRVNFRRGDEESAYYTNDIHDAVVTGKDMAKRSASEAAEDHLTTAQRSRLPASAFAMPEQRKLPIQNRKHVRAAASRLSMMLHDGTISQADHDRALKRVQRAGRRLGVNVSAEGGTPGTGDTFRVGGKDKAAREAYEAAHLKAIKGGKGADKWQVGEDAFTQAYVFAALWSSTDDEGNPLDDKYEPKDLARSTLAQMEADCARFQRENERDLNEAYGLDANARHGAARADYKSSSAGHDFWLTRNGHGAGFWDRGLGAVGDRLTEAAKTYGQADLYIGDDGKIYQAGAERAGRHGMHAVHEAGEPAKEDAGVGCAPCDAAVDHVAKEERRSRGRSPRTTETVRIEQRVDKVPCSDGTCVPWLRVERDSADYEKRMEKAKAIGPIETPQQVFDLLAGELGKEDQEVFVVICLDMHGHLRGVFEVARGQRSKVSVGIQDVMRPILLTGCEGAIICHCHPSNNSSNPSKADRQLTRDIEDALKPFSGECTLIDHVVVTTDTWYSIMGNESSTKRGRV